MPPSAKSTYAHHDHELDAVASGALGATVFDELLAAVAGVVSE